jgi:hypothetical protein
MNPKKLCEKMALVAYELSVAEGHERKAAAARRRAMTLQGEVHCEFSAALAKATGVDLVEPREVKIRLEGAQA